MEHQLHQHQHKHQHDHLHKEVVDVILKYMKMYKDRPNLEIEFRIGYNEENTFNTDISAIFFDKIFNQLEESSVFIHKHRNYTDTFYSIHGKDVGKEDKDSIQLRHSSDSDQYIQKTKLCSIDLSHEPFDVRISFSCEEPFPKPSRSKVVYIRNKSRNSFEYKYWSYDLTKVVHKENSLDITKHEVELELKVAMLSDKGDEFLEYLVLSSLLKIKDMANMCEKNNTVEFEVVKENVY